MEGNKIHFKHEKAWEYVFAESIKIWIWILISELQPAIVTIIHKLQLANKKPH